MKIYTCYFAKEKKLDQLGIVPVSICSYVPNWFRGLKFPDLAPPEGLLFEAKNGQTDLEQCAADYRKAVLDKLDFNALMQKLEALSGGKDIALCCYVRPTDFCHRQIVAAWLREQGVDCEEYSFGPKIEQPSLFD